jgi:hypothetical protein
LKIPWFVKDQLNVRIEKISGLVSGEKFSMRRDFSNYGLVVFLPEEVGGRSSGIRIHVFRMVQIPRFVWYMMK